MRTDVCRALGIQYPVFAFSHCRDVVIEASRAGGIGVLGAHRYPPEKLDIALTQIERQLNGAPYGVDILFPLGKAPEQPAPEIPNAHREFLKGLLDRFDIPESRLLAENDYGVGESLVISDARSRELIDVILAHRVALVATGLGTIPPDIRAQFSTRSITVAALVGSPEHARRHVENGADIIVATGTEAGGHTGEVGTMVMVPEIVDAVAPVPVLAAGGIADGRQIAAALALGAQGVWMGSAWLATIESDLHPLVKQKLLAASTRGTVRTKCFTGKPSRQLRTAWTDAWEDKKAPPALPAPIQGELVSGALIGAFERNIADVMGTPAGQCIGLIDDSLTVREMFFNLLDEYATASDRLSKINESST